MRRLGVLAKIYAVEVVIVLLVLVGMVDTVLRSESAGSPNTSLLVRVASNDSPGDRDRAASALPVRGSGLDR
jgi:hypothetical protein